MEKLSFDRITQKFVDKLNAHPGTPIYELSPKDARKVLDNLQQISVDMPAAHSENKDITQNGTSVNIRILRPAHTQEKLPVIIYMHGGGWVLGNQETHNRLIHDIVHGTNAAVVFVNYTPAPEGTFPQAHEQGYAAAQWIAEHGKELHLDPQRMVIAGDSVGGQLATAIAMMAIERKGPKFKAQCLFYPVTNDDFNTPSYIEFAQGPWLTRPAMQWFWDQYVPKIADRAQPLASPLKSSLDSLKVLPQTFITTNEFDVLRDEGEAYGHKLTQAGVQVVAVRALGMIHDCLMLNDLAQSPTVKLLIEQACAFLKKSFTR